MRYENIGLIGSLFVVITIAIIVGCTTSSINMNKVPEYQKTITLIEYPSHEKNWETKLTLWKFINTKYEGIHLYKDNLAKRTKEELEVRKLVKDEGLYINKLEYIEDKYGDTYLICEASHKPTFREDWQEYHKHKKIMQWHKLQNEFSTNINIKCDCRYCISGLDDKYWY